MEPIETLEWAEDYGQYKKGDAFDVSGPSKEELLKSGKLKVSKKDVAAQVEETQALPSPVVEQEKTAAEVKTSSATTKPSTTAKKK